MCKAIMGWVGCLGLIACSPTTISVKTLTDKDYSTVEHYAWTAPGGQIEVEVPEINRVAVGELIRERLAGQLNRKGLTESAAGEADILIRYFATIEDVSASEEPYRYIGNDPFETQAGGIGDTDPMIPGVGPRRLHDYDEGTLVVEALDATTGEVIWRGTARSLISVTDDPETVGRRLDKTLDKLFKRFPPSSSD